MGFIHPFHGLCKIKFYDYQTSPKASLILPRGNCIILYMLAPNQLENKQTEKLKSVDRKALSNTDILGCSRHNITIVTREIREFKLIKVEEIQAW